MSSKVGNISTASDQSVAEESHDSFNAEREYDDFRSTNDLNRNERQNVLAGKSLKQLDYVFKGLQNTKKSSRGPKEPLDPEREERLRKSLIRIFELQHQKELTAQPSMRSKPEDDQVVSSQRVVTGPLDRSSSCSERTLPSIFSKIPFLSRK